VHSKAHFASVRACPETGEIAELAVSQTLGAASAIANGTVRNAFCAVRPPGHHSHNHGADYDGGCQGEGFCFLNNVAIATRYIQKKLGFRNVLIVDWDYHYGNGTNWAVAADPSVMFYSTHNQYAYPGTGDPSYTGESTAPGHTVNVHLNAGAVDADILKAWDNALAPRIRQLSFKPDFVVISAGFDSRINDLLGSFSITDAAFAALTLRVMALADEYCNGRVLSVLEGGYNVDGLGRAVCAHAATLAGLDWKQFVPAPVSRPRQEHGPHRKPSVRQGLLHLPDDHLGNVDRVVVYDAAGREVYAVPRSELHKPVIDLWPRSLAAGMFSVVLRMNDGSVVRVPFGDG